MITKMFLESVMNIMYTSMSLIHVAYIPIVLIYPRYVCIHVTYIAMLLMYTLFYRHRDCQLSYVFTQQLLPPYIGGIFYMHMIGNDNALHSTLNRWNLTAL